MTSSHDHIPAPTICFTLPLFKAQPDSRSASKLLDCVSETLLYRNGPLREKSIFFKKLKNLRCQAICTIWHFFSLSPPTSHILIIKLARLDSEGLRLSDSPAPNLFYKIKHCAISFYPQHPQLHGPKSIPHYSHASTLKRLVLFFLWPALSSSTPYFLAPKLDPSTT